MIFLYFTWSKDTGVTKITQTCSIDQTIDIAEPNTMLLWDAERNDEEEHIIQMEFDETPSDLWILTHSEDGGGGSYFWDQTVWVCEDLEEMKEKMNYFYQDDSVEQYDTVVEKEKVIQEALLHGDMDEYPGRSGECSMWWKKVSIE